MLLACICTPRHGGSTEPALPTATGIRPVREKEKRKSQVSIHVHSCIIAQEGRSSQTQDLCAYNWSKSRLRRVKDQAEDHGHTGMDHHQPISSQGVCFEL